MALKPGRSFLADSIEYFMFSTASRGGVVYATTGTLGHPVGEALDSASRRCEQPATPSGRIPLGILMWDVVNIDQSRQMLNPYKSETQIGSKVLIYTKGRVVTDQIIAGEATGTLQFPCTGYGGISGQLCTTATFNTSSGFPVVGKFLTGTDSDGYAEFQVEL